MATGEAPYDNKVSWDRDRNAMRKAVLSSASSSPATLHLYTCTSGSEDDKADHAKACAAFEQAVRVAD
jgi:hypothetical protein